MNRFKRSVSSLLLAIAATVALLPVSLPSSVPEAFASCNILNPEDCGDYSKVNYCNSNDPASSKYCSIDQGTAVVGDNIQNINKERKFSQYVQDVTTYLLSFLALVGVAYLLFAGFTIMTSS
ncbi:MAG: hypothetical protein QMC36_03000 [Patescibacteria group bacterium]